MTDKVFFTLALAWATTLSANLIPLGLTLYGDGLSQTFSYIGSRIVFNALPGQANAGFGFQLDAMQAAAANRFPAAHPTTQIDTAATASGGLSASDESVTPSRSGFRPPHCS